MHRFNSRNASSDPEIIRQRQSLEALKKQFTQGRRCPSKSSISALRLNLRNNISVRTRMWSSGKFSLLPASTRFKLTKHRQKVKPLKFVTLPFSSFSGYRTDLFCYISADLTFLFSSPNSQNIRAINQNFPQSSLRTHFPDHLSHVLSQPPFPSPDAVHFQQHAKCPRSSNFITFRATSSRCYWMSRISTFSR
jgi:hypothetical protein